jgi:hypothetical protein
MKQIVTWGMGSSRRRSKKRRDSRRDEQLSPKHLPDPRQAARAREPQVTPKRLTLECGVGSGLSCRTLMNVTSPRYQPFWLAAVLAVAATALLQGADWPEWRGPARTGISAETGLASKWSTAGENLAW